MHPAIEKARKAAGISSLRKNYPENPKHRGCGYWAGFVCVAADQFASYDAQILADQRAYAVLAAEKSSVSEQLAIAEKRIAELTEGNAVNVMEAVCDTAELSADTRLEAVRKIKIAS